jgi:hypothetical protein
MIYKLYKRTGQSTSDAVVLTRDDGLMTSFIFDPANTDYQQYLAWVAEGNQPEPAEEQ